MHLTETCAPAPLHVLTHVATTPAPVPDIVMTAPSRTALVAQGIAPQEHVVDQGYVDADLVVRSQTERGIELVGPVPAEQAKTHLHHLLAAVAMNLVRFVNWVTGVPLAPTRTSAFAALAAT